MYKLVKKNLKENTLESKKSKNQITDSVLSFLTKKLIKKYHSALEELSK